MPDALSLSRSELPEEIATAIEELMRQSRGWYCAPEAQEVVEAREALTAAILSRLREAEAELNAGLREAESLAVTLYKIHWREQAPNWQPLPDIPGLISQIDNMTAGMVKPEKLSAALARVARLEKALEDLKDAFHEDSDAYAKISAALSSPAATEEG